MMQKIFKLLITPQKLMGLYKILKDGEIIESPEPGEYAGYKREKIFGTLDCKSGMLMRKESRVFFHTLEDAIREGYRPCKKCRPLDQDGFESIQHLLSYVRLEEFYTGGSRK